MGGEAASPPPTRRFRAIVLLQDRIAASFEISPEGRTETVARMLSRSRGIAAGYWLQLILATGIATLGLVLDSTAVVIGAMLISPLMSPLVELGMGLAIGSPYLVIRSAWKTALSVVVVVTSATLLTVLLPFHEITSEIVSRTSPTALDLGVATLCALAAAYAVIRPGSDTTATAAGTAIGIALVPPLCVVGFGFGTRSGHVDHVAGGASLLFTANLCAILLFAVLSFLLLGYSRVPQRALEEEELGKPDVSGLTVRLTRRLQSFFTSRYGPLLRVVMPLVLVVAVYIPLRTALAEVTWQIRVRGEIQSVLDALPHESVESSVKIERRRVSIRMVTVGRPDEAAELKKTLEARVERVAGVKPTVQVIAVPDAEALRRLESTLTTRPRAAATALPQADVSLLRTQTADALRESWPTDAAGALRRWELGVGSDAGVVVDVSHFGPPLGTAGQVLLGRSLSVALGSSVTVRDRSLSETPIVAPPAAGVSWLPQAQAVVDALRDEPALFVCIEAPVDAKGKTPRDAEEISRTIHTSPAFADPRVSIADGERWSVHLSQTACTLRGTDAGTDAATSRDAGDAGKRAGG